MTMTRSISIPSEASFGTDDFRPASELEVLAAHFMERYPNHHGHLRDVRLCCLWKRAGGKSRGQLLCGKAEKVSGLARFWGAVDYVVWLAADHLRGRAEEDIANCLFHELLHIGTDPDTGEPKLMGHDLEFFFAEVSERGLWRPELAQAHEVFAQMAFPGYEQ